MSHVINILKPTALHHKVLRLYHPLSGQRPPPLHTKIATNPLTLK